VQITPDTRVYIKNFGDGNYMWREAFDRSAICLIEDAKSHELFVQGLESEYREYAHSQLKTSNGVVPDEGTISLWWNTHARLDDITKDDLFIHDDGSHLFWTQISGEEKVYERRPDPHARGREGAEVIITFYPTQPWRKTNLKNAPLALAELHPHTPNVVRTRMTMAEARQEYADYIISLIRGDDLERWFSLPKWKATLKKKKDAGRTLSDWEASAVDIIYAAKQASKDGGKEVISKKKEKPFGFSSDEELRLHILELHSIQDGLCELTGMPYTTRIGKSRGDMMMSLDRVDSSLGYVRGNLQLTCWFANRWKGASDNGGFIQLINMIRETKSSSLT
jgi:hypothetical protein